jgi:hypothetical protein
MSEREDRLRNAREHVRDAHDELYHLDEAERDGSKSQLECLDKAIVYATVVLDATDADLLTANAASAVVSAAQLIANGPSTALQSSDSHADALLNAVALIPAARDRDVEQQVKDAAATFQRSAGQRLSNLNEDLDGLKRKLNAVKTEIDTTATTFTAEVTEQAFRVRDETDRVRRDDHVAAIGAGSTHDAAVEGVR